MIAISRADQSQFLDEGFIKKAFIGIERISNPPKEDPFEQYGSPEIWSIKGNKLLKSKRGTK